MAIPGNYWDHVNAVAETNPRVLETQYLKGEMPPREQALDEWHPNDRPTRGFHGWWDNHPA